jgi:hypothetical protein
MNGQIHKDHLLDYLLAGRAVFTLRNEQSGGRFTFKVIDFQRTEAGKAENKPDKKMWWVKVLSGPDNVSDYTFIGTIFPVSEGSKELVFKLSKKSSFTEDTLSVKVFKWFLHMAQKNAVPDHVHMFHEGQCGRCGRRLTVPESIASGYGPECIHKVGMGG